MESDHTVRILNSVNKFAKDDNVQELVQAICQILGKKIPVTYVDFEDGNSVCNWLLAVINDKTEFYHRVNEVIDRRDGLERPKCELDLDLVRKLFTEVLENGYGLHQFQKVREMMNYYIDILGKSAVEDYEMSDDDEDLAGPDSFDDYIPTLEDPHNLYETALNTVNLIKIGWFKFSFITKLMKSDPIYRVRYISKIFIEWTKKSTNEHNIFITRDQWKEVMRGLSDTITQEENPFYRLEFICSVGLIRDKLSDPFTNEELNAFIKSEPMKMLGKPVLLMYNERSSL